MIKNDGESRKIFRQKSVIDDKSILMLWKEGKWKIHIHTYEKFFLTFWWDTETL